jgi:hypothetical protein
MSSMPNMPSKSNKRELGTGVAIGLVVGGVIATVLSTTEMPFSAPVGAFIGGACGAYVVYDRIGPSTIAGALSGVLSLPFFLGLSQIFAIFEIIPIPAGPLPALKDLQSAIVVIMLLNILAGAVGGSILGAVRHPTTLPSEAITIPKSPTGEVKYCVQCGAQLPTGNATCPHCGAKQP